jgi:CRISPR system Cascade subunit CasB
MDTNRLWGFPRGGQAAEALAAWWAGLEQDRGDRARLRRAGGVLEIFTIPAFHRLAQALRARGFALGEEQMERLALVASLSAAVRHDDPGQPVAKRMALGRDGKAAVSEARFRRLVAEPSASEAAAILRRLLPLIGDTADLAGLADAFWRWEDGDEKTRRTWALDYYTATTETAGQTA